MIIVTQDNDAVYSFDSIVGVEVNENYIHALEQASGKHVLGRYDTEYRADEVFVEFVCALESDKKIYEMPEK